MQVLLDRRRPVNVQVQQAAQSLPVSPLDPVEHVADRWYLLCQSVAPPGGQMTAASLSSFTAVAALRPPGRDPEKQWFWTQVRCLKAPSDRRCLQDSEDAR